MRSLLEFNRDLIHAIPRPRLKRPLGFRGRLVLTRCPGPTRSAGGVHRCVIKAEACTEHEGWPMVPMAIVWWIHPWWPNRLGRLQDRGLAHTPNIVPCRYCQRLGDRECPR